MSQPPPYQSLPQLAPPSRTTSPWWKRTWVVAVAAAIVGLGIGGAAGPGNSKTKTGAKPGPTVTATMTTTLTAMATVTATPTVIKTVATRTRTVRVTYTPPPPASFGDGTYVVGTDIQPGTYHADGGQGYCAWIRASDKSGSNIIDLGNTTNGPLTVVVQPSDGSLVIQGDCQFHRVS